MIRLLQLMLFCFMWQSVVDAAVLLDDLYDIEVEVASQEAEERSRALRVAFGDVLIKVSGKQSLEEWPQLLSILDRASSYVQQYRYLQLPLLDTAKPGDNPSLRLWVKFDGKGIEDLLQKSGLPIWAGARPSVLVWLAIQGKSNRYLLSGDNLDGIFGQLVYHAKRRGIPILLPLLDLEDRDRVGVAEVWGNFSGAIIQASERYAPDAILVGSIYKRAGGWGVRWNLLSNNRDKSWSAETRSLSAALATGMDGVANTFASRYALQPSDQVNAEVSLSVTGLRTLQDYAKLNEYFATVPYILESRVVRIDADRVTYSLLIRGKQSNLKQSFELGNMLKAEESSFPVTSPVITGPAVSINVFELNYRLAK